MRPTKDTLDFLVIGAQKAGTTSLFEYLRRHPEIYLPTIKEAPYFSQDAVRRRGWEAYLEKIFPFADPGQRWGTVTTHYMFGAVYDGEDAPVLSEIGYDERTVPERIHECLPDVRLIAILRDPVERARSHHAMAVLNGIEHRSFEDAIDALLSPEALERHRRAPQEATAYVVWGEYGRILKGYFDVFPPSQILVAFTDELENDPKGLLRRIHEFLEVTPGVMPDNLGARYRESGTSRKLSWLKIDVVGHALAGNRVARALWHRLPQTAQRWADEIYTRVYYWIDLRNRSDKQGRTAPIPDSATVARLQLHFAQDSDQLEGQLGKVPPWHVRTIAESS